MNDSKLSKTNSGRTPRPYLSWSQLNLFERNPLEFAGTYLYGENRTNPRMALGKLVAEMIEKGEAQADRKLEFYRTFLPQYPKKEYRIEENLGPLALLGILDGWDPKKWELGEFKTGSRWTQRMADETGQLAFYALLLYLAYGIHPDTLKIKLYWMPTVIDPLEGLKLTGDLTVFETKRTMEDLLDIAGRAKRAWAGIQKICTAEMAALGL